MSKHWVRQQVRHNELQDVLERGLVWVKGHRRAAAIAIGLILLLSLVGGGTYHVRRNQNAQAWQSLGLAQSMAFSGMPDQALKQIQETSANYPNTQAAGYARLLAGDLHFLKGQYKEALAEYSALSEGSAPEVLKPLAVGNVGLAQEALGRCRDAAQTDQRFLDSYSEHFLAPQIHSSLARCLKALGQADQAKAAYQKIALQYPETSWAAWAKAQTALPSSK
ncbi:MAG: tetratricopeptide repeat protein [Elusimicrobia bacterium]|nr:tetratricopeptide repeat protein [Elusimicrobiota bacterium]